MKILLITTDIDHIEPYQFVGAASKGAQVRVMAAHDCENLDVFQENGIPVEKITYQGWRSKSNIGQIRNEVEQFKPDIVHVLRKKALLNTIPALKESRAKLIVYRGIVGNLSFFDPKSLLSFLNPRVDRIVCVAEAIRQHFLLMGWGPMYIAPHKVVTIHKGHVVERYDNIPTIDLAQYGVPKGLKVISFCGSMRPRKGGAILIDAFSKLQNKDTALLLVGEIKDKAAQLALDESPRRDRIFQTGKVSQEDALSIAGSVDVTTMPSTKREGLPRALIEAMAQGTPAVVTDVGGSPELVEDGVSGLVVDANDVDAFSQALDQVLEEPCLAEMSANARLRIRSHFDVKETIESNWSLYTDVLRSE